MASPVVAALWRKPTTRPQVALARAAATTGAVVVLWGLLRLGGVWSVADGDVSRVLLGRGRAGSVAAADPAALAVGGVPPGGGDRPATLTKTPSAADLEGIRKCKDAARHYMLTHLKDFHAENGAWGLKAALLALRGTLVDAGTDAATAAGNTPAAPLVVDVGANRGQNVPIWHAIYGEAAHVVLVEGNPVAAKALSSTFADKSDSVAVVQRLVGNETTEMHFRVPKGDTSLERAAIQSAGSVGLFPDEFDYVVRFSAVPLGACCSMLGCWPVRSAPVAHLWCPSVVSLKWSTDRSHRATQLVRECSTSFPVCSFPPSPSHHLSRDWLACCS